MSRYLDESLSNQLKEVFQTLDQEVILRLYPSTHEDYTTLEGMILDLTDTSNRIKLEIPTESKPIPYVQVGAKQKIAFQGIPGGHEFSSLVLAILNSAEKGKRPDQGIIDRILKIKGPVHLKTYVSLSCENCPDVVQALNLIASIHPEISHTMVEGSTAQDEINHLRIQGVPSVVWVRANENPKMIHSGKSNLLELIQKLENDIGIETSSDPSTTTQSKNIGNFDVAVVGGGPAGVSAAIYIARKGLKTVLITDRMGGQLQETKGIENMISVPYTEGPKLAHELYEHLKQYPIQVLEYRKVQSIIPGDIKTVLLESGEQLQAKGVIISTGAKWRELNIPGEKENIGSGVAFCAHCDGPFYKNKKVVVVGGGNSGVEAALDLAGIATHVTLLEYGSKLKADSVLVDKLQNTANAEIRYQAKTTRIESGGGKVTGLEFEDLNTHEKNTIQTDGVFVQIGLVPNSQFLQGTLELNSFGEIVVDAQGRTSSPGIYACGDVTPLPFKQIVTAMGDGAKVALTLFQDLQFKAVSE